MDTIKNYPSSEVVIIEVTVTRLNTEGNAVWRRTEYGDVEVDDLGPCNYRIGDLAEDLCTMATRIYTEEWGSNED